MTCITGTNTNPTPSPSASLPAAVLVPVRGSDLTNADVTVNPASDKATLYSLPAATLTANHVLTLGVSGSPITNSVVQIERRDLTSNTYTVKNDSGTSLLIFAATPTGAQGASFYFDGTHYNFLSFYYIA